MALDSLLSDVVEQVTLMPAPSPSSTAPAPAPVPSPSSPAPSPSSPARGGMFVAPVALAVLSLGVLAALVLLAAGSAGRGGAPTVDRRPASPAGRSNLDAWLEESEGDYLL